MAVRVSMARPPYIVALGYERVYLLLYKVAYTLSYPMGQTIAICRDVVIQKVFRRNRGGGGVYPFKPEFTIVIFIHYKP